MTWYFKARSEPFTLEVGEQRLQTTVSATPSLDSALDLCSAYIVVEVVLPIMIVQIASLDSVLLALGTLEV